MTASARKATPDALGGLLWRALAGDRPSAGELAEAWGGIDDGAWDAIDVVVQNRRLCVRHGGPEARARQSAIEASVAAAWPHALAAFDVLAPKRSAAGLRALALLSRRFPSNPIHPALYEAMFDAADLLTAAPEAAREAARSVLAAELVPSWHQTLDHATQTQMMRVLRLHRLHAPADAFVGWIWAWRFGIDRARDYVIALRDACRDTWVNAPLALADGEELAFFAEQVIPPSMSRSPRHPSAADLDDILDTLLDTPALHDWWQWLTATPRRTLAAVSRAGHVGPLADDAGEGETVELSLDSALESPYDVALPLG